MRSFTRVTEIGYCDACSEKTPMLLACCSDWSSDELQSVVYSSLCNNARKYWYFIFKNK